MCGTFVTFGIGKDDSVIHVRLIPCCRKGQFAKIWCKCNKCYSIFSRYTGIYMHSRPARGKQTQNFFFEMSILHFKHHYITYRRATVFLISVFVVTNFLLIIVTYQSQETNKFTTYQRRDTHKITNRVNFHNDGIHNRTLTLKFLNSTLSENHKEPIFELPIFHIRKRIEKFAPNTPGNMSSLSIKGVFPKMIQRETLVYPKFNITEPNFISSESKLLFYKFQPNRERIGMPKKEQLYGEIVTIRRGTFSMPHDCGYRSNVSHVLEARDILPGRWLRSLIPMIVPDGGTFQHFLDGTLPKIIQALEYIQRPQVKLLMPRIRDSIIYEILGKLNISREKIVSYSGSVGADYLVYTCVTPPLHPLLWQKARSLIGVPEKCLTPKTKAKIVIITRKGCFNCGRLLLNKKELKSSLERKYSESSVTEFEGPLNLSESISLFGSTGVIIGVHGGGLYNINFCPSNTTVIEIIPTRPDGTVIAAAHQIFWTQSILLGHDYWRIPTKPDNGKGDVKVNITLVENVIDRTRKT